MLRMFHKNKPDELSLELFGEKEIEEQKARIEQYKKDDFAKAKSLIQLYLAGKDEFKTMSKEIVQERIALLTSKPYLATLRTCFYTSKNNYIDQSILKDSLLMGFSLLNRLRKDIERFDALPDQITEQNAKLIIKQLLLNDGGNNLASFKYYLAQEIVMRKVTDPKEENSHTNDDEPRYLFKAQSDAQAAKLIDLVTEVIKELEPNPIPAARRP